MSRRSVLFVLAVAAPTIVAACADGSPTAPTPGAARFASGPGGGGSGSGGSGGDVQALELRDDCDSVTFNAAIGAGACARRGSVTFDKFIDELTKKRAVGAWKNNPDQFGARVGAAIEVSNVGGETHSFTRVAAFGGGVVPLLNQLSGNTAVAPECAALDPATLVPAGGHLHVGTGAGTALAKAGTYRFQCCIHPWMRTTATLK